MKKISYLFFFITLGCFSQQKLDFNNLKIISSGIASPTCSDGIQNGNETGVDCGGPDCPACPTGDPSASIAVSPITANEAVGTVNYMVTLSAASSGTTTVNYTVGGTATSGSDFTALSGSVDITNGNTTGTIALAVTDDVVEEGNETVQLTVASGTGYTVGSPSSATFTITDNDSSVASCTPGTPISVTTLEGLTGATSGSTVRIDAAINASGATFAPNLVVVAGSNVITGTNINLNGACINDSGQQIFASTVTFSSLYTNSRLSPDAFGGISGDATADDAALGALINNCQYATAVLNGTYIKNAESTYNRGGTFDWDMNGARVETTSAAGLSHGSETFNLDKYLWVFTTMTVNLSNGEFDGGDIASRCMRLQNPTSLNITNVHVHNYLSPANAYARAVAFKINLYGSTFTGGSITNSVIENIGATSDGVANNTPYGVSKGFYCEIFDMGTGARTLTMSGNRVENIYGDDAEGMMTAPGWGSTYDNQDVNVYFDLDNETYIACQRRAFKINASNFDINNSTIRSATNAPLFSGAQATMLHIFSIQSSKDLERVRITNNQFEKVGQAANFHLGVTDARDVDITGNTFTSDGALDLYDYVTFGNELDAGGQYDGGLDDVNFSNNTLINVGIQFFTLLFNTYGTGITIDSNTMDFDITSFPPALGGAIFWYNLSGTVSTEGATVSNTTIDINLPSSSTLWAALKSRNSSIYDYTMQNVDVTYSGGAAPAYGFGHFPGDFDSTNSIIDCDITGASGTGAIVVDGANKNAVITNSFGDGGTAITIN